MGATLHLASLGLRRGRRGSTTLMLIVIALAGAALTAGLAVSRGAGDRIDAAFDASKGPHLVVYSAEGTALAPAIAADPDVAEVGEPVRARSAVQPFEDGRTVEQRVIELGVPGSVGYPALREGRWPTAANEIALDASVAIRFGIEVGEQVDLLDESASPVSYAVTGTAFDFSDCFYPNCDPGRSWVVAEGLGRLGSAETKIIYVALTSVATTTAVADRLTGLGERIGVNDWSDTRADLLTDTDFFAAFLGVFGVFTLLAAGVVIAAGMGAKVVATRRRNGLLKALGATTRHVTAAMTLEGVMIGAVAAAVGWVAGSLLAPRLAVGALRVIDAGTTTFDAASLVVVVLLTVVIVAVVTVVPAWRAGRAAAVDALRGGVPTRRRRGSLGHVAGDVGVPASVEIGLRTWSARPFRSATTVAAIVLVVVGAVVSLSINASIDHLFASPRLTGDPWDAQLDPPIGVSSTSIERQLTALAEVGHWYTERDATAQWNGERIHVTFLGGDPDAAQFVIGAGRRAAEPGEAVVGYGLIDDGVKIGDTLTLVVGGRTLSPRVVGWYRDAEDSGRIVQLRDDGATATGAPATYSVTMAPGTTVDEFGAALRSVGADVQLNRPDDAALNPFRHAMTLMTILVAIVAIAHLIATTLTTSRERSRSTAIVRAIGATGWQGARVAMVAAAASCAVAIALGLPLGMWLQGEFVDAITSAIGIGPGLGAGPPFATTALVLALLVSLALGAAAAVTVRANAGTVARQLAIE